MCKEIASNSNHIISKMSYLILKAFQLISNMRNLTEKCLDNSVLRGGVK
jgi:hypothetical protein